MVLMQLFRLALPIYFIITVLRTAYCLQLYINKLIKVTGSNENLITIDLSNQIIQTKNFEIKFNIDARRKEVLIEGIDDISETLKLSDKIKDYENKKALKTPWMFNS